MLEISALHAYYGRAHILDDVTFTVGWGEVVALLGRNGAGKSTTLKAIMGLVPAAKGWISFDGHDLIGRAPHQIARLGLGYVPEERRIFPDLTVAENLEVGRQPPRKRAPHWTPERLFVLFPNLAELRARPAGQISGGEQQMLTIARTLMGNPELLLLDEPSEGLAPLVVDHLREQIARLKREGLTILLAEQNVEFSLALAERVYVLEKGSIRFTGAAARLRDDESLRHELLAL
jgi:branched-chain amino acid transport system ATP-binding protein